MPMTIAPRSAPTCRRAFTQRRMQRPPPKDRKRDAMTQDFFGSGYLAADTTPDWGQQVTIGEQPNTAGDWSADPAPTENSEPVERRHDAEQPDGERGDDEHRDGGAAGSERVRPAGRTTGLSRQQVRQVIRTYLRFAEAGHEVRQLAAVLLGTSGKRRWEPDELAVAALVDQRRNSSVAALIERLAAQENQLDRLVEIASLSVEQRSDIWRVLYSLDLVSGSPGTEIGTARRLTEALEQLGDAEREQLSAATALVGR